MTWLPALLAGTVLAFQLSVGVLAQRGQLVGWGHWPEYLGLLGSIPFYALLAIPAVAGYRMAVFNRAGAGRPGLFPLRRHRAPVHGGSARHDRLPDGLPDRRVRPRVRLLDRRYHLMETPAMKASAYSGALGLDTVALMKEVLTGGSLSYLALAFFGSILFSLVQPIVVAEHRIGVGKSLRMLWLGNALRLTVVWAIVGVTFLFLATSAYTLLAVYGKQVLAIFMPHFDKKNLVDLLIGWTAMTLVPAVLIITLALGVTAGINGFAYRTMMMRAPGAEK